MAILTEDDILIYAPKFANLVGTDALIGQLAFIQSIIESQKGTDRPIEVNEFVEQIDYTYGTPYKNEYVLSYCPIVFEDGYEPKVEIRTGVLPAYEPYIVLAHQHQTFYNSEIYPYFVRDTRAYVELEQDSFEITPQGRLILRNYAGVKDIRVTYKSGLDFSQNTNEIKAFKAQAGNLFNYVYNSGAYKGIAKVAVPQDEYEIEYNTKGISPYEVPSHLMTYFKKYRPYTRVVV